MTIVTLPAQQKDGFSLVEMALVLVILALLTGGILAGQSLIANATLRNVQSDTEAYKNAVIQFRDKYQALPGDMYNATSIWGARDGGDGLGTDCIDQISTNALTCNGNGNGQIASTNATGYEAFRAWQHLSNAEMIVGRFTGKSGGTNAAQPFHSDRGINVPQAAIKIAGFNMRYDNITTNGHFAENILHHYLVLGAETSTDYNDNPAITTEDAYHLDKKSDDGFPGRGKIVSYNNTRLPNCTTTNVAATSNYSLNNTTQEACAILFRIALDE